jgi:flagellar basal-body rod protein FlgB
MLSSDSILGPSFGILTAGMDGLALRAQAHSQNIANLDTPGYTPKTVDFESTLKAAIDNPGAGSDPMNADGAALPSSVGDAATGAGGLSANFTITDRSGTMNTASEVEAMVNDNVRYRVLSQQVTNRISTMRSVLSELGRG